MTNVKARPTSMHAIMHEVCVAFGLRRSVMLAKCRKREIVDARNAVMWIARDVLNLELKVIARCLGGMDHSTIVHGLRRAATRLEESPEYRKRFNAALEGCLERPEGPRWPVLAAGPVSMPPPTPENLPAVKFEPYKATLESQVSKLSPMADEDWGAEARVRQATSRLIAAIANEHPEMIKGCSAASVKKAAVRNRRKQISGGLIEPDVMDDLDRSFGQLTERHHPGKFSAKRLHEDFNDVLENPPE